MRSIVHVRIPAIAPRRDCSSAPRGPRANRGAVQESRAGKGGERCTQGEATLSGVRIQLVAECKICWGTWSVGASVSEQIDLANTAPDIQVYLRFGVAVTLAYPVVLLATKAGNFDVSESTFGLCVDAHVMRKTYRGLSRPTAHAHVIAVFGHTPEV